MEMKLLEALDYYLVVYHPYRPLLQYDFASLNVWIAIAFSIGITRINSLYHLMLLALKLLSFHISYNDIVKCSAYRLLQDAGITDLTQFAW
jgi:hypothetical protein